jgi:apolipoprotein N-acyltransferase
MSRIMYPLALALGACNTLAFAPTPHGGWLELPLIALLALLLGRSTGARSAALLAGCFGFGNFVTGVWWVYVSMHDFGGMSPLLARTAAALLAFGMALYSGLAGALWWHSTRVGATVPTATAYAASHATPHGASAVAGKPAAAVAAGEREAGPASAALGSWRASLMLASAWALGNWLRGTVFTGFPWLATGYPQVEGPFAGYAALFGVYGVGWLVALTGALLAQALYHARRQSVAGAVAPLAVAAVLLLGGPALTHIAWTQASGAPLSVRLLQGNVPQDLKFSDGGIGHAIEFYQDMITAQSADLIVTPETALPVLTQQIPRDWGQTVREFVDRTGTSLIFGAIGATPNGDSYDNFTNSLYGVSPSDSHIYHYDKHHLVPFGEFVPLGFHWFVNLMNIPLGDFARGAPVQPQFVVHGQPLALDICYEDIFGEEIADTLRAQQTPATIVVNATNLGYFGNTIALPQELQMAQMRALETGRPVLSATNTGPTAAILPDGRIDARLPVFTPGSLSVTVQGRSGLTPYIRFGNTPVIALCIVLLAWGIWRTRRKVAQARYSR